ncbi:hypothetical protein SSPO_036010 [Streptomyces antimycoticus]|uniref:Histidine kinase/HSP90-like ATPase domain-containing protein n=1 Tax=Streptomyces antimycoticus TaxID=68175 RepID=A0A499UH93_9ACTN|nr:hypothetical protein SSPO_036010 [Streptomyces antimycoticus]
MAFAPQDPRTPDPSDPIVDEGRVDYVPTPISVTRARRHAARLVAEWGHPAFADDAALIVSELATNAVRHARIPGRLFRVQLTLTKTRLRIAVSDPRGERLPRPAIRRPATGTAVACSSSAPSRTAGASANAPSARRSGPSST